MEEKLNDRINKLFPKEKLDKDPNFKATIDKYMSILNQAKSLNASLTKTPTENTTPRNEKGQFTKKVAENVTKKLTKQLKSK